jgi:hypothetical protein
MITKKQIPPPTPATINENKPTSPTHFHSLILKGVFNVVTHELGWRIIGLWGDEDIWEGNSIGPVFGYNDFDKA